jgi:hypothetical protein
MTKSTMAKMRKGAWSPAARKKAMATRAANRAKREALKGTISPNAQDALAFLLKTEAAIIKHHANGVKRFSIAETFAMLALHALRGEL